MHQLHILSVLKHLRTRTPSTTKIQKNGDAPGPLGVGDFVKSLSKPLVGFKNVSFFGIFFNLNTSSFTDKYNGLLFWGNKINYTDWKYFICGEGVGEVLVKFWQNLKSFARTHLDSLKYKVFFHHLLQTSKDRVI